MIELRLPSAVALAWGAFLMVSVVAGCDSAPPRGPCSRASAPAGCNAECSALAPCLPGLYCSDRLVCTADCSPDVTCRNGATCNSEGRCAAEADAGNDAMPADAPGLDFGPPRDTPPADGACASVRVETTRSTPNVILVIDQSGSMGTETFPTGALTTRWQALADALIGPGAGPGGFIDELDGSVRFGFVTYREESAIAGCPDLRPSAAAPVRAVLNNYDTIRDLYVSLTPGGATPTGDAITATLGLVPMIVTATDEPTIFVLATDGEPNTCENPTDNPGGRIESLAAIQSAFTAGIRTYVLSVGAEIATTHLQDLANAGQGVASGAMYWVATDTASLSTALTTIIGSVASCNVELMGTLDVEQACRGTVTLDGRPLTCDDPNGWRAVDATHIELVGTACEELQTSGGVLDANFPCEVIILD